MLNDDAGPRPERASRHGRRIGLFGGTFDPIHIGHLVTAVNAKAALDLDVVLLVVANEPWQKVGARNVSPASDRLALVEAAVGDASGIEACDLEIRRGGPSYTIDTVRAILEKEPDAELSLVVGADVVATLPSWHDVERLKQLCQLVVVNRPGTRLAAGGSLDRALSGWRYRVIEVPSLEVSSTDLRERAASGRPLEYLVPEGAIRLIRERGLYA